MKEEVKAKRIKVLVEWIKESRFRIEDLEDNILAYEEEINDLQEERDEQRR